MNGVIKELIESNLDIETKATIIKKLIITEYEEEKNLNAIVSKCLSNSY